MPGRVDAAARKAQITELFQRSIGNQIVSEAETRNLRALLVTSEDREHLRDLFTQAQSANPGLRVHNRFAALLGEAPPASATGRIDTRPVIQSPWKADLQKMNEAWGGEPPITKIEDAFSVQVDLGNGMKVNAPTHLFGKPVNVVPYADAGRQVVDAAGNVIPHGDAEIARHFQPGEIGIAIKHQRTTNRSLGGSSGADKENMKLQDRHIGIVVGVEEQNADGSTRAGAITLNNPQEYQNGQWGDANYPMIFVRPKFPDYLSADQVKSFHDNIRTMLVGFNTVTEFPGDYNGGDPLGARSPQEVKTLTEKMIRAVAGDPEAKAWFAKDENQVYCAELAHLAMSAGVLFPLNKATWGPIVGEEVWNNFSKAIDKHNAGDPQAFTTENSNPHIGKVKIGLAPETLMPMTDYAPGLSRAGLADKLAFQPMTMSDIVEQFMRTHLPREQLGEAMAPAQAAVLQQMKPAMLEQMALDQLPETDPRRQAVEALFKDMVRVVGTDHGNYDNFRNAIAPLLEQARQMTGPRGDGNGLFTPPSLFHVVAQGKHNGGLLGLDYVGHGVHYSLAKQ